MLLAFVGLEKRKPTAALVAVGVMHVRHVWVRVPHRDVPMVVRVRFACGIPRAVGVAMVLVVHMRVGMFHRLMSMLVLVMLGEMQPHANGHQ